jgi:hypothetical protein
MIRFSNCGERAANMYTLIGTALSCAARILKRTCNTLLTHIAQHPINQINALLPWNIATALEPAELAA